MSNIILIIIEVIISYIAIVVFSKKYKLDGLYIYSIIATFIACIMNLKQIEIMGVSVPLGFGFLTSIIITGNLITQKKGTEELKKYLFIIGLTIIISTLFLNLSGMIKSSNYNIYSNKSYDAIFINNSRPYIALFISLIISTFLSSKLYALIKRDQNKLVLSNIFSIIICEFFENIVFVAIAYLGVFEPVDIILCVVFRYSIKTVIGIIGTIPLYISNKVYEKLGSELWEQGKRN